MLEKRGCLPLSLGDLREGEAASLFHLARPRGPTGPQARGNSPSALRFSADRPRRFQRPHTPGAQPLPPRPVPAAPPAGLGSQAAAARAGHGPMDQPAESFLRGKRRDGAGRGGGGGDGKGRQRKGREGGSEACGASSPPQETAGEAGSRDPPPGYE